MNQPSTLDETISSTADRTAEACDRLVRGTADRVAELGAVWVRHGAEVGRLALRTQSLWLKSLSGMLEHVADAMEPLVKKPSATTTPAAPGTDTTAASATH